MSFKCCWSGIINLHSIYFGYSILFFCRHNVGTEMSFILMPHNKEGKNEHTPVSLKIKVGERCDKISHVYIGKFVFTTAVIKR